MKRYLLTIFIACLSLWAMAANTISLSSVSGTPQTEVEVAVSLDNSDAISALEITISLSEHLQYVANSATLSSNRSNGHQITAAQVGQELRIYVYNMTLHPLQGNSGELLRFRLLLGNEPGEYTLSPVVMLSDAQSIELPCATQDGLVTILAPKLQIVNKQIDYGHIPIRSSYTQTLGLWNSGNLPLVISNIAVDDAHITPQQTALTIEPYATAYVDLVYAPVNRGAISRTLIVTSNDPNGLQQVTVVADPFSVNELHVGHASGIADSTVTIALTMNNMEPIVAMQCEFVLPEELEYVANSMVVNAERSNGHHVLSHMQGNTLVLAIYSMSNQPLKGNDGEIATFELRLNGSSGTYYLYPSEVILSNSSHENMTSATSDGYVEIQSPRFSGDDNLYFGEQAITENITAPYRISNYGGAPLQIERADFLAEGFSVVEPLPLTINPWEEKVITVAYQPSGEGEFSTTMNLYTNDPNNRLKTVAISGRVYEPNTLSVEGEIAADGSLILSVSLNNYTDVVALQYDIHTPEGMTTSQSAFAPTSRMQGHSYIVSALNNNWYRVVIYSMSNRPFAGNEGVLHQLVFTPQGDNAYCDKALTFDEIMLSSAGAQDKVSQSTISYALPQTKYNEVTLASCDQYIWNGEVYTESGTYTQTLQTIAGCDSIVTLYLTINKSEREEYRLTTCKQYEWHGQIYTESGDYEYKTTTEHGCERVEVLHLTISDREQEEFYETACEEYYWNGQTYTDSGDYTFNTTSSSGCDRTEVLHLTIYKRDTVHYYETACNEYYWDHNWQYYYDSGDYEHYTTNEHGCERVEILHLTIHHSEREEYYVTTCNQYEWHGQVYTEPGDYEYYTTTEYGCERVEVLHLSFSDREYEEYYETACDQYEWHGEVYTESGDYTFNTISSSGCERTEVLHLTIFYSEHEEYNVTACDSYEWNGETYTESGDYEYRTTITHVAEKLYVGYNAQNDPIVGLTPPRGISRFTVDGYITQGAGTCFVGTGTPADAVADEADLRIFDAGCLYYDRMSGRNSCFFDNFYNPFNIEFGNYYARNVETGEYYFKSEEVYEYSNTEHPITLFQNDFGKIHKVQFFDNNNLLWADINAVIEGGVPMIKIDYYEADGTIYHTQKFTENLYAETKTTTEQGCERVEVLHLTINRSEREEYIATACDQYEWHGQVYTASGDYEYRTTTEQGCERLEVLHLTINRSEREEYTATACDQYEWNGQVYTESGNYEYRTTTEQGCERLEVLHLTINRSEREEYTATACDQYEWNGQVYTESGDYTYSYVIADWGSGYCERTEVLHLTINKSEREEYWATACDEYFWDRNGNTYYDSGDYEHYTTTEQGCLRVEVLHLTINHSEREEYYEYACDSYEWHGETYTQSGNYEYRSTLENGCERVEVLHLTIYNSQYEEYWETACDEYWWNGNQYTESGDYTYSYPLYDWGTGTCDRIEVLHLTINKRDTVHYYETACDEYWWDPYGYYYNTSGDYENYTINDQGCERVEVLHLTINRSEREEYWANACDTYEWHGEVYTESGDYEYRTTTAEGCERVDVLHLTINRSERQEYSVTACDSYEWHEQVYTESGTYEYYTTTNQGCERVEVLHLTINRSEREEYWATACDEYFWDRDGNTYYSSGDYEHYTTTEQGCLRVEVLHLTINRSEREEYYEYACDSYEWHGEVYAASGDYEYRTTTADGCERIEVLHLTINKSEREEYWATACDEYFWDRDGNTYYFSGDYEHYTTTEQGCLRVEVLHLTINRSEREEYYEYACDSYEWHGEVYAASGDYEYRTTTADGCERLEVLHLTINKSEREEYWATACDEYFWDRNGNTYYDSGDYEHYTTTEQGCLRVEVLHLTINRSEHQDYYENACDAYEWHGETYTQSGNYEYRSTLENGCERVEVLHLTINRSEREEFNATSCDSYEWHGQVYTESGDYEYRTTTAEGCERLEVLHLTINRSEREEYWETACDSYEWYGQVYTASGDYEYRTTTEQGCERVEVLHLTINRSEREEFNATSCDSYEWHGQVYTESGDYEYRTTTADGCERVEVLHLTINRSEREEFYETACDSYEWYGQVYTESGDYEYHTTTVEGCERLEILHLTILPDATTETEELALCPAELPYEWFGQSLSQAGFYTVAEQYAAGCDSVIHELTLNVYIQSLPEQVTLPIVRIGEAIDVAVPSAEIYAHIASNSWYAPNALVEWYTLEDAEWIVLTTDPVPADIDQITLKYVVDTDCGSVESDGMVISLDTTNVENSQSGNIDTYKVFLDGQLLIIRDGKTYNAQGAAL